MNQAAVVNRAERVPWPWGVTHHWLTTNYTDLGPAVGLRESIAVRTWVIQGSKGHLKPYN